MNRQHEIQGHILMNGLCYESEKDLRFHKGSAWPALVRISKQIHSASSVYWYGMASMGTSTRYPKVTGRAKKSLFHF